MNEVEGQTSRQSQQPSGCLGAASIILGWIVGLAVVMNIAINVIGPSYLYVSPQVRSILVGPFGPAIIFFIPGGATFAVIISILHSMSMQRYLPRIARRRWALVTFIGGFGYWVAPWGMDSRLVRNDVFGLVRLLRVT